MRYRLRAVQTVDTDTPDGQCVRALIVRGVISSARPVATIHLYRMGDGYALEVESEQEAYSEEALACAPPLSGDEMAQFVEGDDG